MLLRILDTPGVPAERFNLKGWQVPQIRQHVFVVYVYSPFYSLLWLNSSYPWLLSGGISSFLAPLSSLEELSHSSHSC
jgi:hypothetical protein